MAVRFLVLGYSFSVVMDRYIITIPIVSVCLNVIEIFIGMVYPISTAITRYAVYVTVSDLILDIYLLVEEDLVEDRRTTGLRRSVFPLCQRVVLNCSFNVICMDYIYLHSLIEVVIRSVVSNKKDIVDFSKEILFN